MQCRSNLCARAGDRNSEEIASDSGGGVSRKRAPETKKATLETVALYMRVKLRSRALAVPATCGPQVQPLSGRIPQHGEEVTHGAQQDKHVPHEMGIPHAFRRIERDARRVGEASCDQPQPTGDRHMSPQRSNRDQSEPTHA